MRLAKLVPMLALSLVFWQPQQGTAQETPAETLLTVDHYLDFERVGGAQISPDGSQIIYTRSRVDKVADRWASELWIMNADGSKNRFLTKGSGPLWSPDGTRIAFMAPGEPAGNQIHIRCRQDRHGTGREPGRQRRRGGRA